MWTEQENRTIQGGPRELCNVVSKSTNQWFGRTSVTSAAGGLGVTIAAPLVAADSVLQVTYQVTSAAGIPPFNLAIRTVNAGSSFEIGHTNSFSFTGSFAVTAHWEITNPGLNAP